LLNPYERSASKGRVHKGLVAAGAAVIATAAALPPTPPARHRGIAGSVIPTPEQFETLLLVPAAITAAITRATGTGTGR
jgi:hypothetical protein